MCPGVEWGVELSMQGSGRIGAEAESENDMTLESRLLKVESLKPQRKRAFSRMRFLKLRRFKIQILKPRRFKSQNLKSFLFV